MDSSNHPILLTLGVNYRTCPVSIREQFSVAKSQLLRLNQRLLSLSGIEECVLLSTCNRTEVYAWSYDVKVAQHALMEHFLGVQAEECAHYFYLHAGEDALFHLGAVAAGLDSMVVGETEIFGQLKEAYRNAQEAGTTGHFANRCFQRSFSIGKKIRSNSKITSGPTSVGAAGVQMVSQINGGLAGQRVLIVGAGDVARTTAQSLMSRGAEAIFVANRSYDRAVELAQQVGGEVIRFVDWIPYLEQIDIILVSTASPAYVISKHVLADLMPRRQGKPLFIMDMSVPRNVDPACAEIEGVYLRDVDALESQAQETRISRQSEIEACEHMLRAWVAENASDLLESRHHAPELAKKVLKYT
ncbi:MAG: glutamyl-tRNA reductase [Akkermansia sp.]